MSWSDYKNVKGTTMLKMGQECYFVGFPDYYFPKEIYEKMGLDKKNVVDSSDKISAAIEKNAMDLLEKDVGTKNVRAAYPEYVFMNNRFANIICAVFIEGITTGEKILRSYIVWNPAYSVTVSKAYAEAVLFVILSYYSEAKTVDVVRTTNQDIVDFFVSKGFVQTGKGGKVVSLARPEQRQSSCKAKKR